MAYNFTGEQFHAVVIGPSVGGACILLAAIILAIFCYTREKKRRKANGNESSVSSTSLFRENRNNNYSTGHLIQPWRTAGSGKVFTIPIPSFGPSETSTTSSSINKETTTATNIKTDDLFNSVTDRYYYQFDKPTLKTAVVGSTIITSDTKSTIHETSLQDNTSNPSVVMETNSKLVKSSREIDHITSPQKQNIPSRISSMSENAWNSTVDQIFDSVLSVHENHVSSNVKETKLSPS